MQIVPATAGQPGVPPPRSPSRPCAGSSSAPSPLIDAAGRDRLEEVRETPQIDLGRIGAEIDVLGRARRHRPAFAPVTARAMTSRWISFVPSQIW